MKIRTHEIHDHGSLDLAEDIPAAALSLDSPDRPALVAPVRVRAAAVIDKDEVLVTGDASARVSMTCARCLARFESDLTAGLDFSASAAEPYVVFDDEVRQALLLALPAQPLCRPRCAGLCARCGRNLNQGPCGCPADKGPSPFDELKKLIK